ncbi:uncharacterized protein [Paramormyrops kingsleyae]|uniref:uncharacterized protein isoform X1 n=1 Tax=Paramormyrops kingsleyae TaxID=1676925 RepID=UPI003B96F381
MEEMKIINLSVNLILFGFVIGTDGFLLHGSADPLTAQLRGAVLLPCFVDRPLPLEELEVEWRRTDSDTIVHLLQGGQSRPESQGDAYKDRAHFFSQEIHKGNFSLLLEGVRTADAGVYKCVAYTEQEQNETQVVIQGVGYSSLHWLILVLCITVTPVVLVTGAFSVWNLIRPGESRQALLCHCSSVIVPSVMMSLSFTLWGVAEGSIEEAVTCVVISLTWNLVLFNVAPYNELFSATWCTVKSESLRLGNNIIFMTIGTVAVTELATKYFTNTARNIVLGGLIPVVIFLILVDIVGFIVRWNEHSLVSDQRTKIIDRVAKTTSFLFLVFIAVAMIVFSVFLQTYSLDTAGKVQQRNYISEFTIPMIMALFPFVSTVFLIIFLRTGKVKLGNILQFWALFIYDPAFFNLLCLAFYHEFFAWMYNAFMLEYLIPITVSILGICVCLALRPYEDLQRFYYLAEKMLLGILFMLQLILSFQYVNFILGGKKEQHVRMAEYTLIYSLAVTSCFDDWLQNDLFRKPRSFLYVSGAFGFPLVNSVALAVLSKQKEDTGEQSLDLRLIVFLSESFFLIAWFVLQVSSYSMREKQRIKEAFAFLQRHEGTEPDQRPHDDQEMEALSCDEANGGNREDVNQQA